MVFHLADNSLESFMEIPLPSPAGERAFADCRDRNERIQPIDDQADRPRAIHRC